MDSELTMSVDVKFNSLLNEIQKSKLNFVINITPCAAYVTIKKSTQVNKDGLPLSPSPPTFLLLEQSLSEKRASEIQINKLEKELLISEKQCEDLNKENASLLDQLHGTCESLRLSQEATKSAIKKLEIKEKQLDKAPGVYILQMTRILFPGRMDPAPKNFRYGRQLNPPY